jgi:hypothetical protein
METDNKDLKIYHYTSALHLNEISKTGIINVATALVPKNERPVVWLSSSPEFEPSALKTLHLKGGLESKKIKMLESCGMARIRVKITPNIKTLYEFRHTSGIDRNIYRSLVRTAKEWGANPERDWYVSYEPIELYDWISVEGFDPESNKWVTVISEDKLKEICDEP